MDKTKFHIAQLRHAYMQLVRNGQRQFAEGLLSPAIQHFETCSAVEQPCSTEAKG